MNIPPQRKIRSQRSFLAHRRGGRQRGREWYRKHESARHAPRVRAEDTRATGGRVLTAEPSELELWPNLDRRSRGLSALWLGGWRLEESLG